MLKRASILLSVLVLASTAYAFLPTPPGGGSGGSVSDAVYDAGTWDGVTTVAPSKNAVRDKIETLPGGHVPVTLNANLSTVFTLSTQDILINDPNLDRIPWWNDTAGAFQWKDFSTWDTHVGGDGSDHADVATNTTHISSDGTDHTYIDQDLQITASPDFANVDLTTGGALRSGTGLTETALLQGYDVDGAAYVTFLTITSANDPTAAISTAVTQTEWDAAYTHVSNDGSDHSLIDQSVISGATPTFSANNFSDGGTNIIPTSTQETNWDAAFGWGDHSTLYELVDSNDFDPDRLAGDTVDDDTVDTAILDGDGTGDCGSGKVCLGDHTHAAAYEPLGVAAADITDSTANSQTIMTAVDFAAMRTALDLEAGTDFYNIAATDSAIDTDISTHESAGDPHAGYMLESNIGFGASNYIQLTGSPGTPDGTKYLRDDGNWVTPSAGHVAVTLDANADAVLQLSAQEIQLDTQTANTVFAGPDSGGAVVPAFRALVDDDIPDAITASSYLPLSGGTLTGEVTVDNLGLEFTEGTDHSDCTAFSATGGGIFYDDTGGVFKKCQDNVLTDLDTGGAETNSLETLTTGIADAEIFIGDGPNSGNFIAVTSAGGDGAISNAGVLTVDNDEHDHTSATITLASTDLSDTADLLYEAELNTFALLDAQIADELLLKTPTGGGQLTDTYVCTWDNGNSDIICTTDPASLGGGSGTDLKQSVNQVTHGLSVGNLVKFTGGAYAKAQADSAANAEVVGIVSAVAGADDFTVLFGGYVSTLSGLTANTTYFLDPSTAGAYTATEPTTEGQISKPVFISVSTTAAYFFNFRGAEVGAATVVTSVTATTPVNSTEGTTPVISIDDAAADGSTKGAASFAAVDFDATAGNIEIDYTNGTAAATGVKGFLTGADWDTFNGKLSAETNTLTTMTGVADAQIPVGSGANTATYVSITACNADQKIEFTDGAPNTFSCEDIGSLTSADITLASTDLTDTADLIRDGGTQTDTQICVSDGGTGSIDCNIAQTTYLADAGTDNIDDTHINWGSGAGPVDASDFPATGSWTYTGTLDISGGTLTLAADQISGNSVSGGTIDTFTSTGIDDNATSEVLQLSDDGPTITLADSPSDNTAQGMIISDTVAEAVVACDIVFLASDGEWDLADANVEAEASGMIGMVTADGSGSHTNTILIGPGICKNTTDLTYSTVGAKLYVPETVGEATTTIPADTGDFVRLVGFVLEADTAYFNPSAYHIEIP